MNQLNAVKKRIGIIVPVFNCAKTLDRFLKSLTDLEKDFCELELIIVDGGSDDETCEILKNIDSKFDFSVKVLIKENSTPGEQRNEGCRVSDSDYFVFIDADCVVTPNWLEKLLEGFDNDDIGLVGGADGFYKSDGFFAKSVNYIMTSFFTTGGMRGSTIKKFVRFYPRSFNMAVKRKAFEDVGGFIDRFYGEDVLFSMAVEKKGYKIKHCPEAVVFHSRKSNLLAFIRQQFLIGKARSELLSYNKDFISFVHLVPMFHLFVFVLLPFMAKGYMGSFGVVIGLLYIFVLSLYSLLIFLDYLFKEKDLGAFLIPFLFLVQQFSYGAGLVLGFLKFFEFSINQSKIKI